MNSTRRDFLKQAAAAGVVTLGANSPVFLNRAHAANEANKKDGRILVVIQLAGGNDGLNTVVPISNDDYYKARPGIGIGKNTALKLNDDLGFHPSMLGMTNLFEEGNLSVIQGVGYPNPDRSHFRSMDIWQSARPDTEYTRDGWLGRSLDQQAVNSTVPALSIGGEKLPLSMLSTKVTVPMIKSLQDYKLLLSERETARAHQKLLLDISQSKSTGEDTDRDFVRRAMTSTLKTASQIDKVANGYSSAVTYPQTGLGQRLKATAQLLTADLGASIFFTSLGGFDTHSQQQAAHNSLLTELSEGVTAFYKDLEEHQLADRVLIVTFSEFGRRVKENGSLGTDHGTAGPMFAISKGLKQPVVGKHPSLKNLDQGDLKYHTDFRNVYATILENWLQAESESVLFGKYKPLSFLG